MDWVQHGLPTRWALTVHRYIIKCSTQQSTHTDPRPTTLMFSNSFLKLWAGARFSRTTMGLEDHPWIFHAWRMKLVTLLIMICVVILVQGADKNVLHSSVVCSLLALTTAHHFSKLLARTQSCLMNIHIQSLMFRLWNALLAFHCTRSSANDFDP